MTFSLASQAPLSCPPSSPPELELDSEDAVQTMLVGRRLEQPAQEMKEIAYGFGAQEISEGMRGYSHIFRFRIPEKFPP